jgi:hypothetical protein
MKALLVWAEPQNLKSFGDYRKAIVKTRVKLWVKVYPTWVEVFIFMQWTMLNLTRYSRRIKKRVKKGKQNVSKGERPIYVKVN